MPEFKYTNQNEQYEICYLIKLILIIIITSYLLKAQGTLLYDSMILLTSQLYANKHRNKSV